MASPRTRATDGGSGIGGAAQCLQLQMFCAATINDHCRYLEHGPEDIPAIISKLTTFLFIACLGLVPVSAAADDNTDLVLLETAIKPWKGDLDGMIDRGLIRILTAYNPLFFSYDGIEPRGFVVEGARLFEARINRWHGKKHRPINVVVLPVPRDRILPYLIAGRGDIAIANIPLLPAGLRLSISPNQTILTCGNSSSPGRPDQASPASTICRKPVCEFASPAAILSM